MAFLFHSFPFCSISVWNNLGKLYVILTVFHFSFYHCKLQTKSFRSMWRTINGCCDNGIYRRLWCLLKNVSVPRLAFRYHRVQGTGIAKRILSVCLTYIHSNETFWRTQRKLSTEQWINEKLINEMNGNKMTTKKKRKRNRTVHQMCALQRLQSHIWVGNNCVQIGFAYGIKASSNSQLFIPEAEQRTFGSIQKWCKKISTDIHKTM